MKALNYLNELARCECALVPTELCAAVTAAAAALGIRVCGGAFELNSSTRVTSQWLYVG